MSGVRIEAEQPVVRKPSPFEAYVRELSEEAERKELQEFLQWKEDKKKKKDVKKVGLNPREVFALTFGLCMALTVIILYIK